MSRKNAKVLVVEDEVLVRDMIAEELRDAGFQVIEAGDGEAAQGLLADPVDVLFTDIRLPGQVDGWAIAQFARSRRSPAAPRAAEVPGAIFMHKPYLPSDVIATIERLLGVPKAR